MKKLLTIVSIFFLQNMVHAQQSSEKLITETRYLLYLPQTYQRDSTTRWPLMFFLHGSGESGSDLSKVKMHGPPQLIEKGKQFSFIVVSPQSDVPSGWDIEALYRLLQFVKQKYRVDNNRIYLTGLSMGGFGTWKLAMAHPDEFAAIAPVCGGGDTTEAWKIRNIPVWCFHGALDRAVPIAGSKNMVTADRRFNTNVNFTIYPDKGHNSWDTTYSTSDTLYNWLLQQQKFLYASKEVEQSILKKYEGWYVGPDGDTVHMKAVHAGLTAYVGKDTTLLKSSEDNLFYFRADKAMDIRFIPGNKVTGFLLMSDRKLWYRRLK